MLRLIFNYKLGDMTNMSELRNKIKMFSINQMVCYHVLLEAFNVINYESSEVILKKWRPIETRQYPVRNNRKNEVKVPIPAHVTSQGFTFYGAKLWNQLPVDIQEITNPDNFKTAVKEYIWDQIPSY